MADTDPNHPQRKVSRYRSHRIADNISPPVPSTPVQDPLARSRSRYKQRPASQDVGTDVRVPALPELPKLKEEIQSSKSRIATSQIESRPTARASRRELSSEHASSLGRSRRIDSGTILKPSESRSSIRQDTRQITPPARTTRDVDESRPVRTRNVSIDKRQISPPIRQASHEQVLPQLIQQTSKESSPPPITKSPDIAQITLPVYKSPPIPITGELFPPPRPEPAAAPVLQDGPPVSSQIRATKATEQTEDNNERSGFSLFRKRRNQQPSMDKAPLKTSDAKPEVDENGCAIIPGIDAPVSAVNAGERRVLLECGSYKMMYTITPSTTPVDLIKSAAITMSNPVDPKSAVLLEYFGSVGVHRAIRRYEHIRDVMNSWDHDAQNSLLLIDPGTRSSETELSLAGVPKSKPSSASWVMYYSSSPGKWDKRTVHLKRDGQISFQKDLKKSEEQNICHLSDFDIYTPTQEKIKKKIKPPKKHCVAVKSQQKSSMFENTTNFVHFFCAGEKSVADDFHAAVQSWRSWYLVNVMGEGNKAAVASPPGKKSSKTTQAHNRMDSLDNLYQLGTFSPLLDLGQFKRQSVDSQRMLNTTQSTTLSHMLESRHPQLAEDEPLGVLVQRVSMDSTKRSFNDHRHDNSITRSLTQRRGDSNDHQRPLIDLTANGRTSTDYRNTNLDRVQSVHKSRNNTDSDDAFTGEGLLAQSQDGWGNTKRGRGVIDGAHARGPMLELSTEKHFVQGSLLHRVEQKQDPRGPLIDRERTIERNYKTGEGL